MAETESPRDRQENELEALKAIFSNELRDLHGEGEQMNTWRPTDVVITLTPQQGSSGIQEVYACVDLHVTCSNTYPDMIPHIALENSKGLSLEKVYKLKQELQSLANTLVGEVMIFELAQHVQQFLHDNNKPGFKSFYEEMMSRQQQEHQERQLVRQKQEDKQREAILDEVGRKMEVLRRAEEKRRRRVTQGEEEDHHQSSPSRTLKVSESSEGSCCDGFTTTGTQTLVFNNQGERKVHRGKLLGHSNRGCISHVSIDLDTGELFVIITWSLKGNLNMLLKQVSSIEQELHYLQRFNSPHLVRYHNIKYNTADHQTTQHSNEVVVAVHLLQEFVFGTSLDLYLRENLPMDLELLRHCATGVLYALQYLHKNNVVHRDLRTSSVFLNKNGLVVVADYSIDRRLYDIRGGNNARASKKLDIRQFGIVFLSLLKGEVITDEADLETYHGVSPPELKDFLARCVSETEQDRWSASQLLEHCFIKTPVGRHLVPPFTDNNYNGGYDNERGRSEEPETVPALLIPPNVKGQSRIQSEFEVLKWLGKGAFGDVLKVKNKLDGGVYAIKRIELNPQNKQLNRKITREVKLLSRLNHENVVRYYNSWIECVIMDSQLDNSSSSLSMPVQSPSLHKADPLSVGNIIEQLAPPAKESSVEWSVSVGHVVAEDSSTSSDEDSSDEEDDWMGFLARSASSSNEIVFEQDGSTTSETQSESKGGISSSVGKDMVDGTSLDDGESGGREVQFMYIQMEFCEKSTLRTAIDAGLYEDEQRMWRLFREMVEGLAHIHEQGMIHRDLKPVNIFLDSNDHVKIGDFGLATTNILHRAQPVGGKEQGVDRRVLELRSYSHQENTGDESLTGHVGTALYVAPELVATVQGGSKLIYNQKVDIYSLGIIFFEMCYPVGSTAMERVNTLLDLRKKDIVTPKDFTQDKYLKQVHIVRWLLNHDPAQRPSSQELLLSSYLPPPQLEEAELQEMVRHTLSNPQSKAYKYLISSCFKQETSPAEHITYYMNIPRGPSPHVHETVRDGVVRVLKRHGATCISSPLLSPPNTCYDGTDSYVRVMAHSGCVVALPHDLRVPFARYIAWSGVSSLRRYVIDRVYREKKVFGFHPRELYECAFDIVTPTPGNLVVDAELLAVCCEVLHEFPALRDKSVTIRLNHMSLLRATLLHCGIDSDKHDEVYAVLSEKKAAGDRHSMLKAQARLGSMSLPDQAVTSLLSFVDTEGPLSRILSTYRSVTKRKGSEAASLATQGLHELETVIKHSESLGVKCNVVVSPGMVYNSQQYSGMIFQVLCDMRKKRKHGGMEVVAAGGRYDGLLLSFRKTLEFSGIVSRECSQSAAGVSISLDRIASALQDSTVDGSSPMVDVVVCSLGRHPMIHEKCTVVRELWTSGIRALMLDTLQTLEEVQEFCIESNIPHIILLKDSETAAVRIRSWDKEHDRFQERKMPLTEISENFHKIMMRSVSCDSGSDYKTDNRAAMTSTESSFSTSSSFSQPPVFFHFITTERMNASQRRRAEIQISSHLHAQIQKLCPKVRVEVLALNLESSVLKTLVTHLDLNAESSEHRRNILEITDKHPRYKKYLAEVCDKIDELHSQKNCPNIFVYSLPDNMYKLIM